MTNRLLEGMAVRAARRHGINPRVLLAVVDIESRWNPTARRFEPDFFDRYIRGKPEFTGLPWYGDPERISSSYGLGQLMYTTALEMGYPRTARPEGLFDPATNLGIAAAYLAKLKQRHGGRLHDMIAAYNSGRPFDKAPAYTRTIHVPRFLARYGARGGKAPRGLPPALLATFGILIAGLAMAAAVTRD